MKSSVSLYYRKYFNDYIGGRVQASFMQLGYTDVYNHNDFQHRRNLSFNTDLWELTIQGDFNFFKFEPGSLEKRFTPYFTVGVGGFHFNPYAYYQDQKYYLQPLGTEGQGSSLYPDRKPYSLYAICIPFGGGVKYNLSRNMNLHFEVLHRFTRTDYLDDVSATYAGAAAFPPKPNGGSNIALLLQDRSGDVGTPIGEAGRQRGNSGDKDQYLTFQMGISFLITAYRCPKF